MFLCILIEEAATVSMCSHPVWSQQPDFDTVRVPLSHNLSWGALSAGFSCVVNIFEAAWWLKQ